MRKHLLLALRFALATVFLISGWEKAVNPPENFLYVLQAYNVLPDALARLVSVVFPWVELSLGMSLSLGLWLKASLAGVVCVSGSLLLVVGQAIVRQLPIDDCGCFGNLVHLPLRGVIFLDAAIFTSALLCLGNPEPVRRLSMDRLYDPWT
jgi:hypothetical protein